MSTFTIRVTSSATNTGGTAYGQQPDLGAPSFLDMIVTDSTDPLISNGVYDAYCLNPLIDINLSPTSYVADNYEGNSLSSFVPIGFNSLTQTQVDQLNWLLAQNFTSDPKFSGQFNFGEVQTAIWKIVGFTDTQINSAGLQLFLNDYNRNVVDPIDINFLISAAQSAVASGNGVLPKDTFFTTIIDPVGNVQPLIVQLKSGKLGNFVWEDSNSNGIQDLGELGVNNVIVELYDGDGNFISSTVTGDDYSTAAIETGYYQFTGLAAGQYQVKFITPADMLLTTANIDSNTQDAIDSDAVVDSEGNGLSQIITLSAGESNQTIDAGLQKSEVEPPKASLGDRLWLDADADGKQDFNDANNNGVKDAGEAFTEAGLANRTVTLIGGGADGVIGTGGDDTSVTTQTDADGVYNFAGLTPGVEYQVQFGDKPANTVFTTPNVNGNSLDALDSDADKVSGKTQVVTLAPGEHNPTLDAGVYELAKLSGFVYADTDNDGIKDAGEVGIGSSTPNAGVLITLTGTDGAGNPVNQTTYTDANGFYQFIDLVPGTYTVSEAQPAGFLDGKDTAGSTGGNTSVNDVISNIVLTSGANSVNNNFGEIKLAPGIDIEKTTNGPTNSNPIAPNYDNEDTANGSGVPILTVGSSVTWTYKVTNTGNTDFTKSAISIVDDNGTTSNTDDMTIANGKIVYQSGDANNDNVLNAGESWIYKANGIVQQLSGNLGTATTFTFAGNTGTDGTDGNTRTYTAGGINVEANAWSRDKGTDNWQKAWLGSYGGGLGVTDSSEGSGSGNTHTVDNNGRDNYIVFKFSQNVVVDKAYLGYVSGDSDLSVYIGSSNSSITSMNNAVLAGLSKEFNDTDLTGARWADFNNGNTQGNVLIIAARDDGHSMDYFKLEKLVAQAVQDGGIYVNKATVTAGGVSDFDLSHYKTAPAPVLQKIGDYVWEDKNFNGIQDGNENGISGVTVNLLSTTGSVLQTTKTDANGKYGFDVNAGNYQIQVVSPNGYFVTKRDQGTNDGLDSDINSSGMTGVISVAAGQNNLTIDAGLYRKASIGDRVWEDSDHDGIQDAGEIGIGGIRVSLLNSNGSVIANTTTNSTGNYLFSNLDPGVYSLRFDKADVWHYSYWNAWHNMNNWRWGAKDVGSNDHIDSDVNNSGSTTRYAFTAQTFLESGENDRSWDAAITPIVIDLNGDGIKTISRADSQGTFDLFGNGKAIHSGWISGDDGFLVIDRNGNGVIEDITELFGGLSQGEGFAKLAEFDSNGDGWVDANDDNFASLLIWQDKNGNHQSDEGELLSLSDAGIASLSVNFTELPFVDAQGNLHFERSTAVLDNGQSVDMTDVYFNVSLEDAADAGVQLSTMFDLLGDTVQAEVVDAGYVYVPEAVDAEPLFYANYEEASAALAVDPLWLAA